MKQDNYKKSIIWALVCLLTLSFTLYNSKSYAEGYRYEYFSLSNAQFPPGFQNYFNHTTLGEDGKVYGQIFDNEDTFAAFAVYENGVVTTIPELGPGLHFQAFAVNKKGLIGGMYIISVSGVFVDTVAALIEKDKLVKLPGIWVCDINDSGTALVQEGIADFSIVKKGIASPVDFGPIVPIMRVLDYAG